MADPDTPSDSTELFGKESNQTQGCSCCGDTDDRFEYHTAKVRLQSEGELIETNADTSALAVRLPDDVQGALERLLHGGSVQTLGDWVDEVRERTGGGSIAIEDLCHEQEETEHWGDIDGQRYYFTCFFDAVVLAALTDERVELESESPEGTTIEATATNGGDLRVDPPGTLVSFGVATTEALVPDDEPTREDVYSSMCPVVKAFPSPQSYERWSRTVPAATVAMPLEDATDIAAALAE